MTEDLRLGLSELLRKAMIEQDAGFLNEDRIWLGLLIPICIADSRVPVLFGC